MKIIKYIILFYTICIHFIAFSQKPTCGTYKRLQEKMNQNPDLINTINQNEKLVQEYSIRQINQRTSAKIITIPVVVHVIYNQSVENISDNQIYSQIAVLNQDYRKLNSDTLNNKHPFYPYTSDTKIEFCLANIDPQGNKTNGITRTKTNKSGWKESQSDDIFFSSKGGHDNWDPNQYLNIYVVNLIGTTLGFANLADEFSTAPELDGVVIRYEAFGTIGTSGSNGYIENNRGRTATHEVGHWLNLNHIWGDITCGDDLVQDTEPAEDANYGAPTFPHRPNNSCGSGKNGEMYMNYMDYVDDTCMHMFTIGQTNRMISTINTLRTGILTSKGCQLNTNIQTSTYPEQFKIYSNEPKSIMIELNSTNNYQIIIYNIAGEIVKKVNSYNNSSVTINPLPLGFYIVKISTAEINHIQKIFLFN